MKQSKEKCCADCKHCIRHDMHEYECNITATRNRITGKYEYIECEDVIDTPTCRFKDVTCRRVIMKIVIYAIAIAAIVFLFFAY